jgi:acetoin utilization deacetylase AcuC-like enzyme
MHAALHTFHNPVHSAHRGQQEMFRGRMVPCHEVPERLDFVLAELQRRPVGPLSVPEVNDADLDSALAGVHTADYLDFLSTAWTEWVALDPINAQRDALPSVWPLAARHGFRTDRSPHHFAARLGRYAFDSGTPLMSGTWLAARAGAACAVAAARSVLQRQATSARPSAALALTRPPGHHAGPDFMGGYCFLNNAALAAQTLRHSGLDRVAVLDVDYHHGNGTQTIFYERPDVLTVSIHGDPLTEYPFFLGHADETGAGAGAGFNLNLPLPRGTGFGAWRDALDRALQRVADFGAQALVVPLGLDTCESDPISGFRLASGDFLTMGQVLAGAGLPTVFTFEGGYAVAEVGVNAANVLHGFANA